VLIVRPKFRLEAYVTFLKQTKIACNLIIFGNLPASLYNTNHTAISMRKLSLKELNRVSPAEFKLQERTSLIVVLDNVRSGLNVGSAFRTADAFALEAVYLCGITAQPPHREILKTAIGATESMDWQYFEKTTDAMQDLRDKGYTILAIEQAEGGTFLQNFDVKKDAKYAVIFGNEVKGVSDEVMALVDTCIEVPQFGTKHSLNISVCVGVVTWELFRKIKYD